MGVGKVFNISQKHPIGTVKLGETGSGVRDMAWLPSQVHMCFGEYIPASIDDEM